MTRNKLHNMAKQSMADSMTGCNEKAAEGGGLFVDGRPVTDEQAQDLLFAGKVVEAPHAGAGSYDAILTRLGYQDIELAECSSSSGNWTLVAFDGMSWYPIWQANCSPKPGFAFNVGTDMPCDSKELLCEMLFNY